MTGTAPVLLRLAAAPQLSLPGRPPLPLPALDAVLLAWLALEGATAREQLAALLWPDSTAEAARNALRQRLFRLRKLAGRDLVTGSVQLALAGAIEHDLDDAHTLLAGLRLPELGELEAWLERRRSQLQGQARQQLESRIDELESDSDIAAALPLAQSLLQTEPHSEDAHRRVMRLHYLRGDRAAALLAFDRCESMLKHEVGAKPGAQTLALLEVIEASGDPAATAPAGRSAQLPVALLRPPRLIGRDAELTTLRQARAAGGVALLIGDAGMGKSRLLQALASARSLVVAARPGDALVPYATLARLLAELQRRWPAVLDMPLRRRLAPVLPALAPEASGTAGRAALDAPMSRLLQRLAGELDGLVLDDLHFADTATVELLQALLAAPRPTKRDAVAWNGPPWCLGLRPAEPQSAQQRLLVALTVAAPCTTVHLQPLSVAAMAELVDSLHLRGVSGERVAPLLCQRSGGNPLFALESLKLAWGQGGLSADPAASTLAALPTPQSLTQLISQQLARLSAPALMLARLAAIAGADFSLPLAEQVLGQSALALADPWHELEVQRVLVGTEFAHDLIFEAVIAGVPAIVARHLHAQVAARLEAGGGEPARVAAHWEAAGERERALPGLRAAAERAHAALREGEHIQFLLRAADIAEGAGQLDAAFDCVAGAVDSHMNTIRQASGYPLLDRLESLARSPAQRALAWGSRAWFSTQLADHDTAIAFGERAPALALTLEEKGLAAMIRQRLAAALGASGRLAEALVHMQAVLPQLASSPRADERGEFHGNMGVLLDNLGRLDEAALHRERAIAAARELGDHAHQVSLWANHAVSRLRVGDLGDAGEAVQQARRLIAAYDLQGSTVGFVAVLRQQIARAAGHYDEAFAAADEARHELQASNPTRLPVVALHEGHCWIDLGQPARARQALQACGETLPVHFEARRQLLLARVARLLAQDPAAHLAAAQRVAPSQGWPEVALLVQIETAAAAQDQQRLADLEASARAQGLHGAELEAWLHREAAGAGALTAARRMLGLGERYAPALAYRGELWWHASRTLAAAGAAAEAAQVREQGRRWVMERTQQDVAAALRDGFLRRNPVNAALLTPQAHE